MTATKTNYVYWVTDLSTKAQELLTRHCKRQLKAMGYCNYEIERFIEDLPNEKLGNLSELVSNRLMIKYSNL